MSAGQLVPYAQQGPVGMRCMRGQALFLPATQEYFSFNRRIILHLYPFFRYLRSVVFLQ